MTELDIDYYKYYNSISHIAVRLCGYGIEHHSGWYIFPNEDIANSYEICMYSRHILNRGFIYSPEPSYDIDVPIDHLFFSETKHESDDGICILETNKLEWINDDSGNVYDWRHIMSVPNPLKWKTPIKK